MSEKVDVRKLFNGAPKPFTLEEFNEIEFQQPRMLVDPFLPTGGIGILYGRGGSGKTQVAMSMCVAVNTGTHFLSKFRCREGKVAFLQVDTPPIEFQKRTRQMAKHSDISDMLLLPYDTPVDLVALARKAMKEEELPDWCQRVRDFEPDLLVLDSLKKCHNLDENDNASPNKVYTAAKILFGPGVTLLFIHHSRKNPQIDYKPLDDDSTVRGAGAWTDDADVGIHLVKKKKEKYVTITWDKIRTCEEDAVKDLQLDFNKESLLLDQRDTAYVRAFQLANVGVEEDEIKKILVKENLCGDKRLNSILGRVKSVLGPDSL